MLNFEILKGKLPSVNHTAKYEKERTFKTKKSRLLCLEHK